MPSGVADGALIIDTGLDNSGFIRDAGQFRRAVESMVQAVQKSGQQMGQSMNGYLKALQQASGASKNAASGQSALEKEIAKTEAAVARLEERQELARRKFEASREEAVVKATDKVGPYKGAEDYDLPFGHPETVEEWQERVSEAVNKAIEDFGSFEESATFRNLSTEAEFLNEKLAAMRAELAANREEGASAGGGVAAAFANIAQTAGKAAGAVAKIAGNAALSFLKKLAAGARNAAIQLAKLAGRAVVTGLKKIGQLAGGAAKKLFGLGKSTKSGSDGFKHLLKNMMRYGLGIRSLYFLFNKLRTAVKEGFAAMAGSDERVAAALASLKGALSGLKGSLAAAFAPILTAVAPALTTLINLLTQAVNAIGMFFAAITGQGYFMAAKGMESVGSAAGSASGSVKELKRQLAGFDELNILSANNSGGGGGGGGGGSSSGYNYEKLPVAGFISDFAEQLKALVEAENWDGLGRLLAGKINGAFDKARQLISWDNLGGRITKIVDAITGTFNGLVDGINWTGIGQTLAEGLNTVLYTINRLITGVDWANLGKKLAEGLNGLVGAVDWTALGELFRNKLTAALDMLLAAVRTFRWSEAGDAIARFLNGLYNPEAFTKLADLLSTGINGAVTALTRALEGFDWGQAATDFAGSVNKLVKDVDWTKLGNLLGEGIQSAITMVKNFVSTINWADAGQALAQSLNGLADRINPEDVGQAISNALKGALDFLTNFFANVDWYKLGQDFKAGLDQIDWPGIKEKLFGLIKSLFTGLRDFITGVIAEELLQDDNHPLNKLIELFSPGTIDKARKIVEGYGGAGNVVGLRRGAEKGGTPVIEAQEVTVSSGSGPIQVTPGNGKTTGSSFFGRTFEGVEKSAQGAANTVQTAAQGVWQALKRGLLGGDLGAGEEQLTRTPRSFLDEVYNFFTNRAFGDEADLLDPELIKRNQKAVEANTKATKEDTKVTDQTTANRQAFARSGGDLNGWDEAFNGDMGHGITVNAGVKFIPQGTGGSNYVNRPLAWLQKVFEPGTDTQNRVELVRKGFTTVAGWLTGNYMGGSVDKGVGVTRSGFSTVASWITGNYMGGGVNKGIGVVASGWTSVAAWIIGSLMGGGVDKGVGVKTSGWTTVAAWIIGSLLGGDVNKGVGVTRSGFTTVAGWITGGYMGGAVDKGVGLVKDAWTTVQTFVQGSMGGTIEAKVKLVKAKNNEVSWTVTQSQMAGNKLVLMAKAMGGVITSGGRSLDWWGSATKYAGGTSRAHGTMFVAGEAGPEIVGHVNGRTEILNQSQLAQTMRSAVASGMAAALRGITFRLPAMATGGVMPYEVSAQIAKSAADIQGTLNANNEDLIQTIISVAGQLVAAVGRIQPGQSAGGMTAQQVIDEINRRTLMFGASPLKGV